MDEQISTKQTADKWTKMLFAVYLVLLFWILLLKLSVQFSYMGSRRTNLIPFNEPSILSSENILNVAVFIPLGIYVGALLERWTSSRKVLSFFLLSLFIEGLQYILRLGAFDVTDIITNTLGGVIGLIIFNVLEKGFNNHGKAQRFINKIAAAGTVLLIVLLALLKMNMLPIRYQ